ncbi:hypothetical protein Csa_010361 [Cucumis sativus]|nr:hypothetical protein Csa_010361 [Cucumis sativus]
MSFLITSFFAFFKLLPFRNQFLFHRSHLSSHSSLSWSSPTLYHLRYLSYLDYVAKQLDIYHTMFSDIGGFGLACYVSLWLNLPHWNVVAHDFLCHILKKVSFSSIKPNCRLTSHKQMVKMEGKEGEVVTSQMLLGDGLVLIVWVDEAAKMEATMVS